MNGLTTSLTDIGVQCLGCGIFDKLFQIISNAAAAMYRTAALFSVLIFCIILAFYILFAVWKNIKSDGEDPFYQKSIKPVLINALIVFALLGLGLNVPRLISQITFEPVADMTLMYTQSMLNIDTETIEQHVIYEPVEMDDTGFYSPQLRDKIILLMKLSVNQFQAYIKLGFAVIDNAFSWKALTGIGALLRHILMFFIGLNLAYQFFKLFLKFCFYFIDVILYMTYFAFFFPFSLVMLTFKNSELPDWMKNLGSSLGAGQIKNIINSIVTLAAAIITYTVIMVIIVEFFKSAGTNTADLITMINNGQVLSGALSDDNLATITLFGCIVLIYVISFLADQIPKVSEMITSSFNVTADKFEAGNDIANNFFGLTQKAFDKIVNRN